MSSRKGYILVMGVSGAGKTTVANAIATALSGQFLEADTLHSPENIAAMRAGIPLTDAMREGWLDTVAETARQRAETDGEPVVIACSALKASYRDRLRRTLCQMFVVFLSGTPETIRPRLERRAGHFMPVSLLESQFADLEPPVGEPDEGVKLDVAESVEEIVRTVCSEFRRASARAGTKSSASPEKSRTTPGQ